MKSLQFFSLLFIVLIINSCKDSNKFQADITELYPLADGTVWNYILVNNGDSTESSTEFRMSQLSNDSKRIVLGLDYSFFGLVPFILEARDSGICIDMYENYPDVTFAEVVSNINSIENEQCAALLNLEASIGENYEFKYFTSGRDYTFEVQVSQTELSIDGRSYQVKVFEIPAGRNNEARNIISEVYFNSELGIVKVTLEHDKGAEAEGYMILQSKSN